MYSYLLFKLVKKLTIQLSSLKSQLESASDNAGKKIKRQIDELTRKDASMAAEEKRLKDSSYEWHYARRGLRSIILAGNVVFAGGEGFVVGIDSKTGIEMWRNDVNGAAIGLAASGGRLIVSSDKGPVYCFSETEVNSAKVIKQKIKSNPFANDSLTEAYEAAAEKILAESGIKKGYALVLDCNQGRLAYELAKRTGTKKSYISRIENGKSDIQLSTFYKLIEFGLGKSLNISIG